jgi:hypothetical protein
MPACCFRKVSYIEALLNTGCMLEQVLPLWGFEKDCTAVPFGNGLINHTWKVVSGTEAFILQKINDQVFRNPEAIATNISRISAYLSANAPQYVFPAPVKTINGSEMAYCTRTWVLPVVSIYKNTTASMWWPRPNRRLRPQKHLAVSQKPFPASILPAWPSPFPTSTT